MCSAGRQMEEISAAMPLPERPYTVKNDIIGLYMNTIAHLSSYVKRALFFLSLVLFAYNRAWGNGRSLKIAPCTYVLDNFCSLLDVLTPTVRLTWHTAEIRKLFFCDSTKRRPTIEFLHLRLKTKQKGCYYWLAGCKGQSLVFSPQMSQGAVIPQVWRM